MIIIVYNSFTSPEETLGIDQIQRVFAHWSQLDPVKNLYNSKNQPSPFYPDSGKDCRSPLGLPKFVSHMGLEPMTTWLKVKRSTNWANVTEIRRGNWTADLQIHMQSP